MRFLVFCTLMLSLQGLATAGDFNCGDPVRQDPAAQAAAVEKLLEQTWDTDKLACAAGARVAAADARAADEQEQLAALAANAHYMYYLDRIVLYDLGHLIVWYVNDVPAEKLESGPMRALHAARKTQRRLLERAQQADMKAAELNFYAALLVGAQAPSLKLLAPVVKGDPASLQGAAHALLAETYYDLPDILGGDLDKAISLMRAARERAPDNARYPRVLAGYLLDNSDRIAAAGILSGLIKLEPETGGLQLLADQLRAAADLARRMEDPQLAARLESRRATLLQQHPYLLKRKVVSAMGHFGSNDPMQTGE